MYLLIGTIIVGLALIIFACYYLNNKVVDYQESCIKPQNKFIEQAIIDETAVAVDVVKTTDAAIKKSYCASRRSCSACEKTRAGKTTRKSQNNAKLRDKRI